MSKLDRDVVDEAISEINEDTDIESGGDVWPSEDESYDEPSKCAAHHRGGVIVEPAQKGHFVEPNWNKHFAWEKQCYNALLGCRLFDEFNSSEIAKFVRAMEIHLRFDGETVFEEGELGDGFYVPLTGKVEVFCRNEHIRVYNLGSIIDPTSCLWPSPRSISTYASGECHLAKLPRKHFTNLSIHMAFQRREKRQHLLRNTKFLEMMAGEDIAKLADALEMRKYTAGQHILKQGEAGNEFFVMEGGSARVWLRGGPGEERELQVLGEGSLFGELALLNNAPRSANVTALIDCETLVLGRDRFERVIGLMSELQSQMYQTDPRKLIADFYGRGDSRGPAGSLKLHGQTADPKLGESHWFAVYRPCSRDAIAKMLSGVAVGKGLNVKGRPAKQGYLSGFVPFCQISDNKHKPMIEESPPEARLRIFYKSQSSRKEAVKSLQASLNEGSLKIRDRRIEDYDEYLPDVFGLDLPEPLVKDAYLMRQDLSPVMGWETEIRSDPTYMNYNLQALRTGGEPKVVLYQYDESEPMNPRGLLIAYAESTVKPVVCDIDTFTVGSKGMKYAPLPEEQWKIALWALEQTRKILRQPDGSTWNAQWLSVGKNERDRDFHSHAKHPQFGYGDPTSYRLTREVVEMTSTCGAVRHGPECFNYVFPEELDDEYLVVWHNFSDKPWSYHTEESLRNFLIDRCREGFAFALNPIWPVRDKGWYAVLKELQSNPATLACLNSWYPANSKILQTIEDIHIECPPGVGRQST